MFWHRMAFDLLNESVVTELVNFPRYVTVYGGAIEGSEYFFAGGAVQRVLFELIDFFASKGAQ